MRSFLGAMGLLFAWLSASDALACGAALRPYYTIRSIAPTDGSVDVPRDAAIVIVLDTWDTGQDEQGGIASVSVTRISSGEVMAGSFQGWGRAEDDKYVWRPDAPLAPQEQYRVDVVSMQPARAEITGPSTMSATFTTSDDLAPPVVLEGELHATLHVGTTSTCSSRNSCGGCIPSSEVEVPALYADVELPRVTGGLGDHGYGAWLLLTDSPRAVAPGDPHGEVLGQVDLFEPALPERATIRIPGQSGAFVPCLSFTVFDAALHYGTGSLCLDEVDVEALLGSDSDNTAPDSEDAAAARMDAGSQSAPSNAVPPDASHADAGQESGCRVASGPASAGSSTLLLVLVALLGTRFRRFAG